jgi:phosphinothricin acetyltransferase
MNTDLQRALDDMAAAREGLLAMLRPLPPTGMDRSRPGGWTVGKVLHHLIDSEAIYAKLLAHQCGKQQPEILVRDPADGADAAGQLDHTREAVLAMVDGIDDETLYRLAAVGREEYSPLSVLQNVALHDREHLQQIAELAAEAKTAPAGERTHANVTIRPATLDDLPRMMDIYNHYVINTPTTFDMEPKDLAERREWFGHYAETGRHRLLVAIRDGDVAGYTSSSKFHRRAAYDTTVETTILCAPEHVGYGIGQKLYEALFAAIAGEDIHSAVALITLPNRGSTELHERLGYRRVGVIEEAGRKFGKYWDVVWYQKML